MSCFANEPSKLIKRGIMNRNRLIAAILSMPLIVGCQIFTPIPESATRVQEFKVYTSADSVKAVNSFVLVSDLDDTVKITNVPNKEEMYNKGWYSKLVFAGMPELYQYLLGQNSPAERLMFLSGSPSILCHMVRNLLDEKKFPAYTLTLRSGNEFFAMSPFKFKNKRLEELYSESKDNFILVGDDTESDPEAYEAFSALKREQVRAIYIHKITGRKLPAGSFSFVTAYDIAMHEFKAHRLSEKQAAAVGKAVKDSGEDTLLPDFQCCPTKYEDTSGLPKTLVNLKTEIERKINSICAQPSNRPSCEPNSSNGAKTK